MTAVSPLESASFLSPHLATLEQSLRESLHKETAESDRRQKVAQLQKQVWEQHRQVLSVPENLVNGTNNGEHKEENERASLRMAHNREQAIEKRKLQVKGKVQAQLNRVSHEAKKLDELRRELEGLEDPSKKEVAEIRKKIESVDREIKPLKQLCERKEKELKEAVESYNEKSKMKTQLVNRLMEVVTTSEKVRMQKLDELNRLLEAMEKNSSS